MQACRIQVMVGLDYSGVNRDTSLFEMQRLGTVPQGQMFFFCGLLQGIEPLHDANIVHRDIWSVNVLANVQQDTSGRAVAIKEVTWTDFSSVELVRGKTPLNTPAVIRSISWLLSRKHKAIS